MSAKLEVLVRALVTRVESLEMALGKVLEEVARLREHSPDTLRRPVGRPRSKEQVNGAVRD